MMGVFLPSVSSPPLHVCVISAYTASFRMSLPSPSVAAPLCLLVLAFSLISGEEDDPVILSGLVNKSVLMSLPGDLSQTVLLASWNFKTNQIAAYMNHQLFVNEKQFKGRLKMLDTETLRIEQLRLEDSGLYTGTLTTNKTANPKKIYNLTVYEPVSTPSLKMVAFVNGSNGCNVTLQCSVPNNQSSLSLTWEKTSMDSNFQLYDKNTTIRMALKKNDQPIKFTCIVKNPADHKNASHLVSCLNAEGTGQQNRNYYGLLAILTILLPLAGLGYYLNKKRKRRKEETATAIQNTNREPQYIQVTTFPSNDDRQVWNNSVYDSSPLQKPKAVTLYAVLQHQTQRDDRNETRAGDKLGRV